ncbi:resuscitation-promoting factor [Actinomyces lilanjuaniae]|uniref:Resuscitation-promoting factor n=1 Tax=Actinomyces lilanjuaniae TaxID=2321394 RepID=A0ABN5PT61_9ACTO|nr:resuscitation-promoting factor [Actinomyces lilanjuaniae]
MREGLVGRHLKSTSENDSPDGPDAAVGSAASRRSARLRAGAAAAALALALSGGAYAAVRAASDGSSGQDTSVAALGGEAHPTTAQGEGVVVEGSGAEVSTVTEEVTEAHGTVEQETGDLPEGERRVVTEGADGVVRTVYQVTTVDGEEVSRQAVSSVVVSEKVDEVVQVGTGAQQAAEPTASASEGPRRRSRPPGRRARRPRSSPQTPAARRRGLAGLRLRGGGLPGSSGSPDAGSDDVWAALAQCESGGDPTTNTGNGYYGMYQFSLSTWQAYGGSGLPSEASAAEQTAVAKRLQAAAGWGQWPHCAAQLGLL